MEEKEATNLPAQDSSNADSRSSMAAQLQSPQRLCGRSHGRHYHRRDCHSSGLGLRHRGRIASAGVLFIHLDHHAEIVCVIVISFVCFKYGLYSAYMGCFVYLLLGSTKAITIGPTALMSLVTHDGATLMGPGAAVFLAFATGCFCLLFGLLNLGKFPSCRNQ